MATCIQEIQSKINSGQLSTITELLPNTSTNLIISSSLKQLFSIKIVKQETVEFTISLSSLISPSNTGVVINFYQVVNGNILFLGNAIITEMIMTFQKDFTIGDYIICISSTTYSYTGTLIGLFTGYQTYVKFNFLCSTGGVLNPIDLKFEYIEKKCNKLLYFSIVDGTLPEGLQMTLSGNIFGILPNMDCTKDNDQLSPSQNWYYSIGETWQPWRKTMAL